MQSTQLSLESARKTWERQQKLFEAGALPQSDLDTAENSFKKSELELATARAKLANDQIKAEQARSDLSGAALVAPFDGIIGAVNGQVGQINGINSTTSTLLCIISEDLQMSALINEADIGRIKVGQEVEFTASAFSNQTFKGQVLRITPQAESVSNIQYYPVLISCIDPKHQLMAGMSVSANIIAARRTDVVTVPLMAISYAQSYIKNHPSSDNADKTKPSRTGARAGAQTRMAASASTQSRTIGTAATQGQPGRVVVLQNNKPIVKTVVLGLSDGSGYEVIEGLKPGDKVILGSNQFNTQSSGSSGSNSNSNGSNRNQGRVIMNGRPPGGF
jgi:HlyD family secretion protein